MTTLFGKAAMSTLAAVAAIVDQNFHLKVNAEEMLTRTYLTETDDKELSSLFGRYDPQEKSIDLYLDAIADYAKFMGVDPVTVLIRAYLNQLHYARSAMNYKEINPIRADKFAGRALRTFNKAGFEFDLRVLLFPEDKSLPGYAYLVWADKWINKIDMEVEK